MPRDADALGQVGRQFEQAGFARTSQHIDDPLHMDVDFEKPGHRYHVRISRSASGSVSRVVVHRR